MSTYAPARPTTRVPLRIPDARWPAREGEASRGARIVAEARLREARARVALASAVARAEARYRLAARELEELESRLDAACARLRRAGYLR